ncbi:hypothetical protein [Sphingomonas sp. SRS2]|uniref:hypothetical protein n=1 Tax=Sphingomonas sp. SRS2 TaxID=133190 RepID=UPI0006184409|nr:hypothetical protein [Sphingomonas sp. SRS2]KKC24820.1 hypothetical protein WP12_17380 [Sphingomonas sp. SRS2]
MAFLQSELPPSTAPVQPRRTPPARVAAVAVPQRRAASKVPVRLVGGLVAAAIFAIPGYFAATATESLAIGILAADFAFLLAVAGWSSIVGGARR